MKKDNQGQPVNLAQLKRALCVGAEFEIKHKGMEPERRRVNDVDTTSIYSIVPFDATARATKANGGRGSWFSFGAASFWKFEGGLCSHYWTNERERQTEENLIFSIRIVEKEEGRDEAFQAWKADLDSSKAEEAALKEKQAADEAEAKNKEQLETVVRPVLDVLQNGGEIAVDNTVNIFSADGSVREQNVLLYIAEKYGVNLPLKLKGWINNALAEIQIKDGECVGVYRYTNNGGKSTTVFGYINQIIAAVQLDCDPDDEEEMTAEEIDRLFASSTSQKSDKGKGEAIENRKAVIYPQNAHYIGRGFTTIHRTRKINSLPALNTS